jgi:prepilin-type N-terminal cleavage/methylation domain-containing protein/prepilin-type processing-associated H-X9-DG protein
MRAKGLTSRRGTVGFTLIELLVVVAIIALLVSILLPSLGSARAQARATLCASRISQLSKGMLLYADDFAETPPFIGVGYKPCGEDNTYVNLGPAGQNSELYFAQFEQWLIPNLTEVWLNPDWTSLIGTPNEPKVERGILYPYTRFASMYRCPDFERVPAGAPGRNSSPKSQNVFNYSRSILGRRFLSNVPQIQDPSAESALWPGPIVKLSAVYNTSGLFMMVDEQGDFHCAGNYNDGGANNIAGAWMAAETIHGLLFDMIASYHGRESNALNLAETLPSKNGNIGYYDGHVDAYQDPLPYRWASVSLVSLLLNNLTAERLNKILDPIMLQIYAQRGLPMTTDVLVLIVASLIA